MKFGISTFVTDDGIDPVSLARAVEELGFGQVALLLPTKPLDESLRLLDKLAAHVADYRG